MLTSYSRVTVVSGTRRVDLALPSALPVADVVPQVLRFCAPEESSDGPVEFTLAKIGGQSLSLSQSLGEAGVHDGDVIELRAFSAPSRPAFIEDVRDAIEDSVDTRGRRLDHALDRHASSSGPPAGSSCCCWSPRWPRPLTAVVAGVADPSVGASSAV